MKRSAGLLVTLIVGCNGVAPVAESQFGDEYAHAWCDPLVDCCAPAGFPFDLNTCIANARGKMQTAADQWVAMGFQYDAVAAGQCIGGFRRFTQLCARLTEDVFATVITTCPRIFSGSKQAGESCSGVECAQPASGFAACLGGECKAYLPASQGSSCQELGSTVHYCDPSATLYCDDASHTCLPRGWPGAPCVGDGACLVSAYCDGSTCKARIPIGSACPANTGCEEGARCAQGICIKATGLTAAACSGSSVTLTPWR